MRLPRSHELFFALLVEFRFQNPTLNHFVVLFQILLDHAVCEAAFFHRANIQQQQDTHYRRGSGESSTSRLDRHVEQTSPDALFQLNWLYGYGKSRSAPFRVFVSNCDGC